MSAFTGPLRVEMSSTKERWATLLEPLVWELDSVGSGRFVEVPAGFESDGITVPRPLWSIIPPWGHPATRAAILHDALIKSGTDRKYADRQFYLALKAVGVGRAVSRIMWLSVSTWTAIKSIAS